jgi:hypothetical protein
MAILWSSLAVVWAALSVWAFGHEWGMEWARWVAGSCYLVASVFACMTARIAWRTKRKI